MPAPRALLMLLALAATASLAVSPGCGRPEGLRIGDCLLESAELEAAAAQLRVAFPVEGETTLRWHLLNFGMGTAALLHAALPEQSAAADQLALREAAALEGVAEPVLAFQEWLRAQGEPVDLPTFTQPNPGSMGASAAAAVAVLEPGEWAGPLRSVFGWELVYLAERMPGARNRANVGVYRMVFPVGDADDLAHAREAWATLPLSGDPRVLDVLPLDFRRDRVLETP